MSPLALAAAYGLDWLVGDPPRLSHPVIWIGALARRLEAALRRAPGAASRRAQRARGAVLWGVTVAAAYAVPATLLVGLRGRHPWLAAAAEVWLVAWALASRGLDAAARRVLQALRRGDLPGARRAVTHLVGRDTAGLDAAEVTRAAVESVAENTSDAVVAPLFYAALGGAPLAWAYKAVNTLDSLVGHKNPRYEDFGWWAARADDWANLVPARLTAALLVAAGWMLGYDARGGVAAVRRDARKHPSPNAGFPEAAAAGLLGVTLGGTNTYGGVPSHRPRLGLGGRPLDAEDIAAALRLMRGAGAGALVLLAAARWLVGG